MVVGVYGLGYAIAARDPVRHWPIVLVGLVGKVLGPVGFLDAAWRGELPWRFGWVILANDLIWWVPFGAVLYHAFRMNSCPDCPVPNWEDVLRGAVSQRGASLQQLSERRPLLVVFLRHAGCIFCREALADLAAHRRAIEEAGADLAIVHMSSPMDATQLVAHYGLEDVHRFSDPHCVLYRAFDLKRGCLRQLLGPRVWWRGAAAYFRGNPFGRLQGDGFQMPGAFVLYQGRIVREFRHETAADLPDYVQLVDQAVRQLQAPFHPSPALGMSE
jgi:hypothetical protein